MSLFGAQKNESLEAYLREQTKRRNVVVEMQSVDVFSPDYSGKPEMEYRVFLETGRFKKTRTAVHTFRTPTGGLAFVSGEGDEQFRADIEKCVKLLTP